MPKEMSRPRTGAQIIPQQSKHITIDINSTPTTSNQDNGTYTIQVDNQKLLTQDH